MFECNKREFDTRPQGRRLVILLRKHGSPHGRENFYLSSLIQRRQRAHAALVMTEARIPEQLIKGFTSSMFGPHCSRSVAYMGVELVSMLRRDGANEGGIKRHLQQLIDDVEKYEAKLIKDMALKSLGAVSSAARLAAKQLELGAILNKEVHDEILAKISTQPVQTHQDLQRTVSATIRAWDPAWHGADSLAQLFITPDVKGLYDNVVMRSTKGRQYAFKFDEFMGKIRAGHPQISEPPRAYDFANDQIRMKLRQEGLDHLVDKAPIVGDWVRTSLGYGKIIGMDVMQVKGKWGVSVKTLVWNPTCHSLDGRQEETINFTPVGELKECPLIDFMEDVDLKAVAWQNWMAGRGSIARTAGALIDKFGPQRVAQALRHCPFIRFEWSHKGDF